MTTMEDRYLAPFRQIQIAQLNPKFANCLALSMLTVLTGPMHGYR